LLKRRDNSSSGDGRLGWDIAMQMAEGGVEGNRMVPKNNRNFIITSDKTSKTSA
jgi:hypothetical protein